MRRLLLGIVVLALAGAAPAAEGRPKSSAVTKPQAIAAVRALLVANRSACGFRVVRIGARRAGLQWRVDAVTAGRVRGTSRWFVAGAPRPANALARRIRAGCPPPTPVPTPPPPSPPPPPPSPPPPPGPGAPATYVYGPEVTPQQQALVRRGVDAAARYYRAALDRELPPMTVSAYADVEALIAAYAAARSIPLAQSRSLWEGGQVAHATSRHIWMGPRWFVTPATSALKIAAHEAFHLFQYELVGEAALSVSGLDEIPRAGPWWVAEGAAEYFAYLAIVDEGALRLDEVRAQWVRSTKATSATLHTLATLRGQRETPGAYDVYALAVERLLQARDPKLVFAYYEAIARSVRWPEAFPATFGRSFDSFADEFEAYRRTL